MRGTAPRPCEAARKQRGRAGGWSGLVSECSLARGKWASTYAGLDADAAGRATTADVDAFRGIPEITVAPPLGAIAAERPSKRQRGTAEVDRWTGRASPLQHSERWSGSSDPGPNPQISTSLDPPCRSVRCTVGMKSLRPR